MQKTQIHLTPALIAASMLAASTVAQAQRLTVPEETVSEPLLWTSKTPASCGMRIHSLVTEGDVVLDYDLQVIALALANDEPRNRGTTIIGGRLVRTDASAAGPKKTAVKVRPMDLYVAIPGVPDIFKFKAIEPGTHGTPAESFSGYPVADDGGVPPTAAMFRVFAAVLFKEPILVSFVMDSSSTGTHTVRVVSNLSAPQDEALLDCLQRMGRKVDKSAKPPLAPQ